MKTLPFPVDPAKALFPRTRAGFAVPFALVSMLAFSGCGGSSSGGGADNSTSTGVFLDSPVANIDYTAGGQSGTTNSNGAFTYTDGDTVVFSVGGITFPSVPAAAVVTPLDMNANRELDETVRNVIRLLQTIDDDGDPTNGITISNATRTAAEGITLDFEQSSGDFENDTDVTNFVANVSPNQTPLKSVQAAEDHFVSTLTDEGISTGDAANVVGAHLLEEGSAPGGIEALVVFTRQGSFYQAQFDDGGTQPDPGKGYEVGSYSVVGNEINFSINVDQNGDTGVAGNQDSSDGNEVGFAVQSTANDELEVITTNDETPDTVVFATVVKNATGLAGSWRISEPAGEDVIVVFDGSDSSGSYFLIENSETNTAGVESGTYSISGSLTGSNATFTASVVAVDSNGDAGLADGGAGDDFGMELQSGDTLVLTEPNGSPAATLVRAD